MMMPGDPSCLVPPGSTCFQQVESEKGEATREARGAQQDPSKPAFTKSIAPLL